MRIRSRNAFPRSPRNGGGKTLKPQTKTNPTDDFKRILKAPYLVDEDLGALTRGMISIEYWKLVVGSPYRSPRDEMISIEYWKQDWQVHPGLRGHCLEDDFNRILKVCRSIGLRCLRIYKDDFKRILKEVARSMGHDVRVMNGWFQKNIERQLHRLGTQSTLLQHPPMISKEYWKSNTSPNCTNSCIVAGMISKEYWKDVFDRRS